jgi:L-threonylcarbamoyladenylate synthase
MEILTEKEFLMRKKEISKKILAGAIFIYPTDTIYGIGCNATNEEAVAKVRSVKERADAPFSVWAPSIEWIKENCQVSLEQKEKYLSLLPGPYTLILKTKPGCNIAKNVHPGNGSLGVRMPEHKLGKFFEELGVPIVTTSVNKSGKTFMTSSENIDPEIENKVEFMIYEGENKGRPSKIINLVKDEVIER